MLTDDLATHAPRMTAKPVLAKLTKLAKLTDSSSRPAAARRESLRKRQAAATALSEFSVVSTSNVARRPEKRPPSNDDYVRNCPTPAPHHCHFSALFGAALYHGHPYGPYGVPIGVVTTAVTCLGIRTTGRKPASIDVRR